MQLLRIPSALVSPSPHGWHCPIVLYWPSAQGRQLVCATSGSVPGSQAEHVIPSIPISLGPQISQCVEKLLNEHFMPNSHGFWLQSAMAANVVAITHVVTHEQQMARQYAGLGCAAMCLSIGQPIMLHCH